MTVAVLKTTRVEGLSRSRGGHVWVRVTPGGQNVHERERVVPAEGSRIDIYYLLYKACTTDERCLAVVGGDRC